MNRIFHARITWYHYFLLVLLTFNLVGALWSKIILPAVLLGILLIFVIEKIIHTTYTITPDGMLEISGGRFSKRKSIPIADIKEMRKCHSMKFGKFSITNYILIEYGGGKYVAVMPVKENEFIELITQKMN